MRGQTPDAGSQILTAIYAALALGVFLFAVIVLFVLEPVEATLDPGLLRIVWFVAAIVATLGAGIVRGRMAGRDAGPDSARTAAIVVWALAEGQAFLGIVGTMLTGDRVTAYASLALFAWLWMRYPPRSFTSG
jgi:F0F1-type ATP synthase membrane subunit c/vacuolar-type H+-ATPase subunit K